MTLALDRNLWAILIRRTVTTRARAYPRKKFPLPTWATVPDDVIGCFVEALIGRRWIGGTVVATRHDDDIDLPLWEVLYDSGVTNTYSLAQLQEILCVDMHVLFQPGL
jgi:hypothetical protein